LANIVIAAYTLSEKHALDNRAMIDWRGNMNLDLKKKISFVQVFLLVFLNLILLLFFTGCAKDSIPDHQDDQPVKGVIDLSTLSGKISGNIKLNGEWEFYWGELLTPEELTGGKSENLEKRYITLPSSWNNYLIDGEPLGGDGYATFCLTIKVPKEADTLALKLPSIYTAHKLWVNGELMSEDGKVGKTKETSKARHYRKVVPLQEEEGEIQLVFQVTNFMHRMGGIWQPVLLGDYQEIKNKYDFSMVSDTFIFGILLVMGLFYIAFYLIKRREKGALYFGLFSLIISLRTISVGNILLVKFFDFLSQELVLRLEYMTFYGGMAAFAGFIYAMFPQEVSKKIWTGVVAVTLLETLIVIFTPPSFFSRILYLYQIFAVLLLFYLVFTLFRAALRRNKEAWPMMLSGLVFFGTVVNDILFYNEKISTGNLYPFGLLVLIFTQAVLVLKRFTQAFSAVEVLNEQLLDKDKLKDEFLADVAHELLTPANGMVGLAEDIYERTKNRLHEEEKRNLSLIVSCGRRLTGLVHDIQDFARLKNRDIVPKIEDLDLKRGADLVLAVLRPLLQEKRVALINDIPEGLYVKADENRLSQILYNLLGNALKFTSAGEIRIQAEKTLGEAVITVSDTGPGIPLDKLTRIFEPYEQVSGEGLGLDGLGLGLPITKKLVELHGGKIIAQSQEGRGAKFIFTLPLGTNEKESKGKIFLRPVTKGEVKDPGEKRTGLQERERPGREWERKRSRILVVDDEAVNREVLKNQLTHARYHVETVDGGQAALKRIEGRKSYDLVILDVMMPEISGYEVCRLIRERYSLTELPVLIITVKNRGEDILKAFSSGANDYLVRSFEKKELLARVNTLISMKRSAQEALEAQMSFLQAQIKPHFIYNALNSIMGLCIDEPQRAYTLLGDFSNYLRGKVGLINMDSLIPLNMEVKVIQAYLNIEKARFGGKLLYEIKIEAGEHNLIPPLILQPLVENAVKHGIYPKEDVGRVEITAHQEEGEVVITVKDDGVGMTEEKVKNILTGKGKQGIGLKNVDYRLRLFYGQGLQIESQPGKGTCIFIRISEQARRGGEDAQSSVS
jgi:two-component system sensor histidine kinase ChiS